MSREPIHFKCPKCDAEHDRGFLDGREIFRCLRCGYQGYGFHPDPEIDRGVFLDSKTAHELELKLGLPGVWPWAEGARP